MRPITLWLALLLLLVGSTGCLRCDPHVEFDEWPAVDATHDPGRVADPGREHCGETEDASEHRSAGLFDPRHLLHP